jgi:hypothetical protein
MSKPLLEIIGLKMLNILLPCISVAYFVSFPFLSTCEVAVSFFPTLLQFSFQNQKQKDKVTFLPFLGDVFFQFQWRYFFPSSSLSCQVFSLLFEILSKPT